MLVAHYNPYTYNMTNTTANDKDENIRIPMMNMNSNNNGNNDDGKGIVLDFKVSIRHSIQLVLAAVCLIALIAYACIGFLTENHFRFVKIIFVPILVTLTIVEFVMSIINEINGDKSENEENVESDDGYVKLDLFSGWPIILMNAAPIISVLGLCGVLYCDDYADEAGSTKLPFELALISVFITIDNIIRCVYSIMMKCRVRKWIKYAAYVLVVIDILLMSGLIGLFAFGFCFTLKNFC